MRQNSTILRALTLCISLVLRLSKAAPIDILGGSAFIDTGAEPEPAGDGSEVLVRATASVILVLLGGVFAGLTIGLMGQDEVYLQVTAETGDENERRCAAKVLKLLSKGKHWVLVTLLLSNVITNETLPIVLDRLLGGGWPAVVSSTAAIVIFGEIIPQSICVRYGLPLGAFFAPFVKVLMYAMYPLAVPIAKLLDFVLGEDHGTIYKKAGLKSLVTLHHHMGIERLNEDEVTIISAVLDLKDKPVSHIMTPIKDVFVLSSDTILDEKVVEKILLTGFNRIPIHVPNEPMNFVGMLLVRTLITYDPDDALPISSFALATLPETAPDTSCLNILNYFQEGKAHMVAVSKNPGAVSGAVGVVTLEDVIEELIGEEIVDESDVYVDVHRAIRRVTPAPMLKSTKQAVTKANQIANNQKIASLRPSNRASAPMATHNSKITIKRGTPAANTQPGESTGQSIQHPAIVSTEIVQNFEPYHDEPQNEQGHPNSGDENTNDANINANGSSDTSGDAFLLAKSPHNVVVKPNISGEEVNVAPTERRALESNLGPDGLNKATSPHRHGNRFIPTDSHQDIRLGSQAEADLGLSEGTNTSNEEDEQRATFSENVVYVNGMNKVVIQDISSSSDEETSSSSSSTKNGKKKSGKKKDRHSMNRGKNLPP